jgi:hypothetical protein
VVDLYLLCGSGDSVAFLFPNTLVPRLRMLDGEGVLERCGACIIAGGADL